MGHTFSYIGLVLFTWEWVTSFMRWMRRFDCAENLLVQLCLVWLNKIILKPQAVKKPRNLCTFA